MAPSTLERCEREIRELHTFFEAWFSGTCPASADAFDRLDAALGDEFSLIIPEGRILQRSELLQSIRQRHGFRAGTDFAIRIEDVEVRADREGFAVATYEEWQQVQGRENGRISSVVFDRNDGAPHGLRWRHLHETWLETPTPDAPPDRTQQ